MNSIRITASVLVLASGNVSCRTSDYSSGAPPGYVSPGDIDRLNDFARQSGVDLYADITAAIGKDENALGRVLKLSLRFESFDRNARAYGQLLTSTMLRSGELGRLPWLSRVVTQQPSEVRQRVRDFLFFNLTQVPQAKRAEVEAEVRRSAPELFPRDYTFASGNPLFPRR